jgi:hypothetical protein
MTSLSQITHCGLPGIDRVPVGMHACHFLSTANSWSRRSFWVTAPPLPAHEAVQALRAAWDGVDGAIQAGALRILDSTSGTGAQDS